jgi:hypothetical protein
LVVGLFLEAGNREFSSECEKNPAEVQREERGAESRKEPVNLLI